MLKKLLSSTIATICSIPILASSPNQIDLAGLWRFQTDPMGFGKTPGSELYLSKLTETMALPGSMDESGKGLVNIVSHVDRLSRKFEYCGMAWYQREVVIPSDWADKKITLSLERCHWETALYVDGKYIDTKESLSTPNRYTLTKILTPGVHTLTICVDNRLKYPMDQWNHGTTEHTQTNWNGMVGELKLTAAEPNSVEQVKVYPNIDTQEVGVDVKVDLAQRSGSGTLSLTVKEKDGKIVAQKEINLNLEKDTIIQRQNLNLGKNIKLWDEFSPSLYTIEATLRTPNTESSKTADFGMRKVEQGKHHIKLNDRNIHLRGVLDCCVFPLTGYPATDTTEWKRIFRTVQEYGLNHVRFHSWCPPKAAFVAADELGIYIQAELPMWIKDVGKHPARAKFFEKEMIAILDEYGNHPSFILYCNGNENEGDFNVLETLIKKGQQYDNRRLYSASTARTHVPADQYYTSHVSSKGWITVYEGTPSTDWDRNSQSDIDVPVIAHETGQRCMYPNFEEIKKYTGILEARNMRLFRDRLAKNGMLHQADDFFKATGAHTVLQYKEVNEAMLRTDKSGGFQLLGLADFPGQGSAFVGILDPFWDSKGLVTPEKYRESCAPTVLLARLPKRTFENSETLEAKISVYHFGKENIKKGKLAWTLTNQAGAEIAKGSLANNEIKLSTVDSIGIISIPLKQINKEGKYTLKTSLNNVKNEWDVWVYPESKINFNYTRNWQEAKQKLANGENVLLIPENPQGRKTKFASHFWNPIMFNWNPLIIGTLIQNQHPALKNFPTEAYADWQWWDILNNATALDLSNLTDITPIIQSIDSYESNQKLGICFETNTNKGKLLVLCIDPEKEIDQRLASQQLLTALEKYIKSDDFNPKTSTPEYLLDALFDNQNKKTESQNENQAIKQLLNQ